MVTDAAKSSHKGATCAQQRGRVPLNIESRRQASVFATNQKPLQPTVSELAVARSNEAKLQDPERRDMEDPEAPQDSIILELQPHLLSGIGVFGRPSGGSTDHSLKS